MENATHLIQEARKLAALDSRILDLAEACLEGFQFEAEDDDLNAVVEEVFPALREIIHGDDEHLETVAQEIRDHLAEGERYEQARGHVVGTFPPEVPGFEEQAETKGILGNFWDDERAKANRRGHR